MSRIPGCRSVPRLLAFAAAGLAGALALRVDAAPLRAPRRAPSATPLSVTAYLTPNPAPASGLVAFNAVVSGGAGSVSYRWDFGDGRTGSGPSTSHQYVGDTLVSVTCTVTDAAGVTASDRHGLTIGKAGCPSGGDCVPEVILISVWDACGRLLNPTNARYAVSAGDSFRFGTNLWEGLGWDFGDGTPGVVSYNPVHVFRNAGTYRVSVTKGSHVEVVFFDVRASGTPPPVSVRGPGTVPSGVAAVLSASANAGSGTYQRYTWDFGDDTATSGSRSTVTHAWAEPGRYMVSCTVLDSEGVAVAGTTAVAVTPTPPLGYPTWVLPALATGGAPERIARASRVALFNPDPRSAMSVRLAVLDTRRPLGRASDLDARWIGAEIAPRATLEYRDVLAGLSGASSGSEGALLVQGVDLPGGTLPVAVALTRDTGDAGSFGFAVPPLGLPGASTPVIAGAADLVGLRETAAASTGVGLVNLEGDAQRFQLAFFDPAGRPLGGVIDARLGPYEVRSLPRALTAPPPGGAGFVPGSGGVPAFRARISVPAEASILAWGVVADVAGGDRTLVLPDVTSGPAWRLPAVVRTAGQGDTSWRSDVVLFNPSASARSVWAAFTCSRNGSARVSAAGPVPMAPGQIRTWEDFVASWLNLAPSDADAYAGSFLDVRPAPDDPDPSAPVVVRARTYNARAAAKPGTGVMPFSPADAVSASGPGTRLAIAGLCADAESRTNVALFLADPAETGPVGAEMKLYDAAGALLATVPVLLGGDVPSVQLSLDAVLGPAVPVPTGVSAVVEGLTGTASLAAYATVIDRRSGDASWISATPIP